MEFRTTVDIPRGVLALLPTSRCLLLGSCFAQHMGQKMQETRMHADVNPFGVLYNPESIRLAVEVLRTKRFSENYFFEGRDGMWHSWLHSGDFSATTRTECVKRVQERLAAVDLAQIDYLFVTFGTSHVYRLGDSFVVGNCHKEPAARFVEEELSVDDIVTSWSQLLANLSPQLQVVFTISPYRYVGYGFHRNQLSKSTLLLAVDALCRRFDNCNYFPAYEIVMDELRDYRFYAADMLHPSEQAVEYVWERFRHYAFNEEMIIFARQWERLRRALQHRPLHPDSEAHRLFQERTQQKLRLFLDSYGLSS